jgi:LysR family glycine cleavage system transcriptional activator
MLVQAALAGQGIALAGAPLVDDLIAKGLLEPAVQVAPFRVRGGYFIVEPASAVRKKATDRFCRWLIQRARQDATANGTAYLLTQE